MPKKSKYPKPKKKVTGEEKDYYVSYNGTKSLLYHVVSVAA